MFDYLNEVIFMSARCKNGNTLRAARRLKARGNAVIFNMLCAEWCSRFKWKSTEKSIDTSLIERTILTGGACGFAEISLDYLGGERVKGIEPTWKNARVTGINNLSYYGRTTSCTLVDYAGRVIGTFIPVLKEDFADIGNCAIIEDNAYGFPPLMMVMYYAEEIGRINTSINACIRNILGTTVISCTKSQASEIERQRAAAEVGVPYIIHSDDYQGYQNQANLMSTPGASEELAVLLETRDKLHGDFLQYIGVRVNNEMNKKSGTTPMEIIENRQNVDLSLNSYLQMRKDGIELCERIGLKGLSVELDNFKSLIGNYDKNGVLIQSTDSYESKLTRNAGNQANGGEAGGAVE